VTKYPG